MMEYDNSKFWEDLCKISSPEALEKKFEFETTRLIRILANDETNVFSTWKAFFSVKARPNAKIFSWLLSFYPEIISKHCKFSISHMSHFGSPKRDFAGCTLLQMMLLLKPCREYFHLLSHTLATCDTEGNSTLLYAVLSANFWIYKNCWALLEGDGLSAKSPGPNTACIIIKADWMPWMKRQFDIEHLIMVLGGLDPAISKCLHLNAAVFTRMLITRHGVISFKEHLKQALSEPGIDLRTLVTVVETSVQGDKNLCLYALIDEILKRTFSICHTNNDYKKFLRLTRTLKEQCKLTQSLDDLVAFTGSPYEFLRLIYAYPTVLNTLNKIHDLSIDTFDMRSSVYGSYLHVVCKRISEFEPYQKCGMHIFAINGCYFRDLFERTLFRHWQVKDPQGNLPIDYLKPIFNCLDARILDEIKLRS